MAASLHKDLENFRRWIDGWRVPFKPRKCKEMILSKMRDPNCCHLFSWNTKIKLIGQILHILTFLSKSPLLLFNNKADRCSVCSENNINLASSHWLRLNLCWMVDIDAVFVYQCYAASFLLWIASALTL